MAQATDVAVVGGGLAGLTAAVFLGRAGHRVTVLEKATALGGRAVTQEKNGFSMNLGAHALYCGGAARRTLDALGIAAPGKLAPVSGGFALHRGALHTLPVGFVSLLTTGLLDLPQKVELARLLASAQSIDPGPFQGISVREWLDRTIRGSVVRGTLEMLFRVATYSADVDRQSAGAAIGQLQLAAGSSVRYLDGGWQTLVAGLRQAALAAGAVVIPGAKVAAVAVEGGAVRGVRLADGGFVEARGVIVAASPGVAAALVPEVPELAAWAARARPVRAACLDLGLSRLPRPGALVTFGVDCPLYLSVHSASARLAPEGGALVHLAKYLGDEDGGDAEAELEALMERVQPGFRAHVVERRFLPSLIVSSAMVTAEGGGLAGRPGPLVPGVRGLAVAGDWVGPEGMLADAALSSAERAAALVLAGEARARQAA